MKRAALILAALAAILTAAAAPVRTATENFVSNKIAEAVAAIPAPDYSTNNAALVETIQAKAPAPDLSPFIRNDKGAADIQEFGGVLFGRYWADSWDNYMAHNGRTVMQTLPAYIQSNPWGFLKQGEAIPATGGVFNVSTMHFAPRLSVGPWNNSIRPIDISGGSGAAFVFGDNVQAKRSNTMTLGVGALNTNEWSYIWNGDANRIYLPTIPSMSNPYATRYNGGYHVNPSIREGMTNPLQNFWIGDTNLATWVTTLALGKTGDQTLQSGILTINRDAPDGDAWLQIKRGNQNGLALAFGGFRMDGYFQALPHANGVIALLPDIYAAIQQIAPAFTSKEYALDELCTYNGVVYRCKSAYTAEIYNPKPDSDTTHWEAKKVSEVFARLSDIPSVPAWALESHKPTYTASEVGAYSTGEVDNILQGYLPLDYFQNGQTIPMYWGDGTKLCDFGANWLGNLAAGVQNNSDAIDAISDDIPPAVSNIVTTALVRERLGVYLYVGADGGIYVHTNED